jgi:hypothetical protein
MRRILIPFLLIVLLIAPISYAENKLTLQSSSAKIKRSSTSKARSGFYLEIKRSYVRAYSGWQKNTIALLRPKGFDAFNGDPKNHNFADNIWSLESIEKTTKPTLVISSVYVGPYRSRQQAERKIPKLLSALKPLIAREKKNDELHNRSLFLVGVVRVIDTRGDVQIMASVE